MKFLIAKEFDLHREKNDFSFTHHFNYKEIWKLPWIRNSKSLTEVCLLNLLSASVSWMAPESHSVVQNPKFQFLESSSGFECFELNTFFWLSELVFSDNCAFFQQLSTSSPFLAEDFVFLILIIQEVCQTCSFIRWLLDFHLDAG